MAVSLTQTIIPDSFGKGGANIGDGDPTLVNLLKQIQANLTILAAASGTGGTGGVGGTGGTGGVGGTGGTGGTGARGGT